MPSDTPKVDQVFLRRYLNESDVRLFLTRFQRIRYDQNGKLAVVAESLPRFKAKSGGRLTRLEFEGLLFYCLGKPYRDAIKQFPGMKRNLEWFLSHCPSLSRESRHAVIRRANKKIEKERQNPVSSGGGTARGNKVCFSKESQVGAAEPSTKP